MVTVLAGLPEERKKNLSLLILLHPEEDESVLQQIVGQQGQGVEVAFCRADNPIPYLLAADLVTGMFSILLAEAAIMQRPVLSIELNLRREEILITNTIGATASIQTHEALKRELSRAVLDENYRAALVTQQKKFQITEDASSRWHHLVEKCFAKMPLVNVKK